MKAQKRTLEFAFEDEGFKLEVQEATDGERVQKEKDQRIINRAENEKQQTSMPLGD